MRAWFLNMPAHLDEMLARRAPPFVRLSLPEPPVDLALLCVRHCAILDCELRMLLPLLARNGTIWIGWPSEASPAPTDINADVVRRLARPLHLMDAAECDLAGGWKGMKLVPAEEG